MNVVNAEEREGMALSLLMVTGGPRVANEVMGRDDEPLWREALEQAEALIMAGWHSPKAVERLQRAAWVEGATYALRMPPHLGYAAQNPYDGGAA